MSTNWQDHLVAGGAAGAVECLLLHPVDVAKTRQQLQITYSQTMPQIMRTILQEGGGGAGGYLRMYRGVFSPLMGMMPKSAVWFASNERIKYWILGDAKETGGVRLIAGFFSGWPEALVVTPFECIKVKLQSRRFASAYKNSWDCFQGIIQKEGIPGLFRGFEATVWRNGIWNALYFYNIGVIKDNFLHGAGTQTKRTHSSQALISFLYGTAAGLIATFVNTPLDLVKSRIQLGVHDGKYRWTWQTLFVIAREEGPKRLWRGLPLRMVRNGLGGGVTICVYELVMRLLQG